MRFTAFALACLAGVAAVVPGSSRAGEAVQSAVQLTYAPATRDAGIAALNSLLAEPGDSRPIRLALARALSWSGRYHESLAHYDTLLAGCTAAQTTSLTLERLQVLLWSGRLSEAARGYERLLATDPGNAAAELGLARASRWSGRPLRALQLAARPAMDPSIHAEAGEELAAANADLELGRESERILQQRSLVASPELASRLRSLVGPTLTLAPVLSHDSFGISRLAQRATVSFLLPGDVRLQVGSGWTHLDQGQQAVDAWSAAGGVTLQTARVQLASAVGAYGDSLAVDAGATLGLRLADALRIRLGARHRPFTELAAPLATGEELFYSAGAGGAQQLGTVKRISVDAATVAAQIVPAMWSYVYVDGNDFRVSDGNGGYVLAAGCGLDLPALLGARTPLAVTLHWDSYLTGYDHERLAYFSPAGFDAHAFGARSRWRVRPGLALLLDGGRTTSFRQSDAGWFGGGGVDLDRGRLGMRLRAEARDDLYFEWRRLWVSLSFGM